jgi:hypothetical protein
MDAEENDAASSGKDSTQKESTSNDDSDRAPDPSIAFLERKARLRAEATAQQSSKPCGNDQRGDYRGNTTSGAFRPLMYSRRG